MKTNNIFRFFAICLISLSIQSCSDDEGSPISSNFSEDKTTILTGESIQFSDNSSGATSWSWTFSNGTPLETITSSEKSPLITFDNYGIYTAKLVISNGNAKDSTIKTDQIIVDEMVEVYNNFGTGSGYNVSGGGAIIVPYQQGNSFNTNLSTGTYTLKYLEIGTQKWTQNSEQTYEMLFSSDSSGFPAISSATPYSTFTLDTVAHKLLKLDAPDGIILQNSTKYWFTMNHSTFGTATSKKALWLNGEGSSSGSIRAFRTETSDWSKTSGSISSMRITARRSAQ